MYSITIIGKAKVHLENPYTRKSQKPTPAQLFKCNGLKIEDDFAEYIDEDYGIKIDSGYTHFEVDKGNLYSVCVYEVNEKLTDEELKLLANYTQGQWSDGIGEGFEQFPCEEIDGMDLYISPWIPGQKCNVTQTSNYST
jgi:hypothetical protein